MAISIKEFTASAGQKIFQPVPDVDESLSTLEVTKNGSLLTEGPDYSWDRITNKVTLTEATEAGDIIRAKRVTQASIRLVNFTNSNMLRPEVENKDSDQLFALIIENMCRLEEAMFPNPALDNNWDAENRKIVNLAPGEDPTDAANTQQVDDALDEAKQFALDEDDKVRAYADLQDDIHSSADRAYADANDASHSSDDRQYTDDRIASLVLSTGATYDANTIDEFVAILQSLIDDAVVDINGTPVVVDTLQEFIDANEAANQANSGVLGDHEDRITQNESDIANHEGRITTNEGTLSNHEGRITTNEGTLSNHESRISQNESDISSTQSGKLDQVLNATGGSGVDIISDTGSGGTTATARTIKGSNGISVSIDGNDVDVDGSGVSAGSSRSFFWDTVDDSLSVLESSGPGSGMIGYKVGDGSDFRVQYHGGGWPSEFASLTKVTLFVGLASGSSRVDALEIEALQSAGSTATETYNSDISWDSGFKELDITNLFQSPNTPPAAGALVDLLIRDPAPDPGKVVLVFGARVDYEAS